MYACLLSFKHTWENHPESFVGERAGDCCQRPPFAYMHTCLQAHMLADSPSHTVTRRSAGTLLGPGVIINQTHRCTRCLLCEQYGRGCTRHKRYRTSQAVDGKRRYAANHHWKLFIKGPAITSSGSIPRSLFDHVYGTRMPLLDAELLNFSLRNGRGLQSLKAGFHRQRSQDR
jgi:hypothetical protein